jgi:hypothetical protein
MSFSTTLLGLSLGDLQAMVDGTMNSTINDIDFLETLAAHKCLIVPPWVMRASPSGGLSRVARLTYDADGNLDKARVLIDAAREFRRAKNRGIDFGPRFTA